MAKELGAEVGPETPSGSTVLTPSSSVLTTPFQSGEIIGGRYRIDRVIAEGGMAVIVAATHIELDETVAIKFLKHSFAVNPEIVGRFAREAKAAARIKSECTAAVHDVGISPERGPYIVMEFLEGEDFQRILEREGALPFPRAAELVVQGCVAIALAHANAIIHRDIKPANLFLLRGEHGSPRVKVLDFGVSKGKLSVTTFGGAAALVSTQSIVGSPAYMAPEQLRGASDVDVTADIWSLGAVLYQLITGRIPFEANTVTDLYAKMLEAPPTPPIDLVPDVPPGLSEAIMRCFALAKADRWQSVAAFVVAIGPYAPRRARAAVDRIVAVSKGAGLLEPGATPRAPTSAPPEATAAAPVKTSEPSLPRLFQTMVDTHGGTGPMPLPEDLPRLFQTMVDTHGGGEPLEGGSLAPPEDHEPGTDSEASRPNEPAPPPPAEMPRARTAVFVLSCTLILASVAFFRWRTQTVSIEPGAATAAPRETVVSPPAPPPAPSAEEPAPAPSEAPPPAVPAAATPASVETPMSTPVRIHRPPASVPALSSSARSPTHPSASAPSASPPATSPPPATPAASSSSEDQIHRAIEDRK